MRQSVNNYKTELCRHYSNKGHCSLFQNCYFAHGQKELRRKVDPLPYAPPPQFTPISNFKTQLCKYFMKGYCRSDRNCPFAHGPVELQGLVVTSSQPLPPPPPPIAIQPSMTQGGQFLLSILRNLQQVFPQELNKKILIKRGIELTESGDFVEANEIINELVNSNTLSDRQREQCQTILMNATALHKISLIHF